MKKNSKMFINVISLIGLSGIFCGQADSIQQMGKMSRNGVAHFGMSCQYATNYGDPLSRDKKIDECVKLSKKLDIIIADCTTVPKADDIEIKVHEGVIHAVRPKSFSSFKINEHIKKHSILFNDLLKSAKEGKTYGGIRIRDINEKIQTNQSNFRELVTTLNKDELQARMQDQIKKGEMMYSNSYDLLGIIIAYSDTHTNKSNIE